MSSNVVQMGIVPVRNNSEDVHVDPDLATNIGAVGVVSAMLLLTQRWVLHDLTKKLDSIQESSDETHAKLDRLDKRMDAKRFREEGDADLLD